MTRVTASVWLVKCDSSYFDRTGGPNTFARWVDDADDATRYRDRDSARVDAYRLGEGARVVRRTRVSFKARAERAEAEVTRIQTLVATIRQWDMLTFRGGYEPLSDGPWLRGLLDDALVVAPASHTEPK